MVSFTPTEDQKMLQETVRKFAAESLRPQMRPMEKAQAVPSDLRRAFQQLGLALADVSEEDGGLGMGAVTAALVHEELAYGDPGAAVALWSPGTATAAIAELGSPEQRKKWLPRLGEGHVGAVAWSERAPAGKTLPNEGFLTTARPEQSAGSDWILDGTKAFVVHGGVADFTVVFAQEAGTSGWDGLAAFVVEGKPAGLSAGARHAMLGLETVHASELKLAGVRIPAANRLAGGKTPADTLRAVRRFFARVAVMNAARQVGLARASYEFALGYTQDRTAFGKPVAHFQSIAFTLADMCMEVEAARAMVWKAARALDLGNEALYEAASATVQANDAAWRVADNGVQLLGGAGFIQDFPVEKWMRDTKAMAMLGMTDELARHVVAEQALGRADFGTLLPSVALQPVLT